MSSKKIKGHKKQFQNQCICQKPLKGTVRMSTSENIINLLELEDVSITKIESTQEANLFRKLLCRNRASGL